MPISLSKLSCRFAFFTFSALGLAQLAANANAEVYQNIEASFSITNLSTDPFDYTVTDVQVQVAQPDSSTLWLPAFFDGGTTWRIRHAPTMPGLYQVNSITLNGQPIAGSNQQPSSWTVASPVISPGYVQVDPANASRFITSNGRRYFPVGHNVAWDTSSTTNVASNLA